MNRSCWWLLFQDALMVESEAAELSEDVMLGAVMFGHQQMQTAIDTINAVGGRSRQV